jgi:hypothetical protein
MNISVVIATNVVAEILYNVPVLPTLLVSAKNNSYIGSQ